MFHFFCRRRVSLVCFQILGSVFCQGSLRLSVRAHGANFLIENLTVRFGAVLRKRKSYGAVRCCDISYGAVRCGFQKSGILRCGSVRFSDIVNLTVRFGAVINPTVRVGAVLPVERFLLRCGANPRRG